MTSIHYHLHKQNFDLKICKFRKSNQFQSTVNILTSCVKAESGINFIIASIANFASWHRFFISFSVFFRINLNSSITYSPYSKHRKSCIKQLTIRSRHSSHSLFSSPLITKVSLPKLFT